MSNIIRFVTKKNNSKIAKNSNIEINCQIILFTGVRYCRRDSETFQNNKVIKRQRNIIKQPNERKRRRST